jgi:hypothetical protein
LKRRQAKEQEQGMGMKEEKNGAGRFAGVVVPVLEKNGVWQNGKEQI